MTLHYEALRAEADYRREQARNSWTSQPLTLATVTATRLWRRTLGWVRRLAQARSRPQPASRIDDALPASTGAGDGAASPAAAVRVHVTCWTDGSQSARRVADVIQEAVGQRFSAQPQMLNQSRKLTSHSS